MRTQLGERLFEDLYKLGDFDMCIKKVSQKSRVLHSSLNFEKNIKQ